MMSLAHVACCSMMLRIEFINSFSTTSTIFTALCAFNFVDNCARSSSSRHNDESDKERGVAVMQVKWKGLGFAWADRADSLRCNSETKCNTFADAGLICASSSTMYESCPTKPASREAIRWLHPYAENNNLLNTISGVHSTIANAEGSEIIASCSVTR